MSTLADHSRASVSAVELPSTSVGTKEDPVKISLKSQPGTQPQCATTILDGESGPRKTSPKKMKMPLEFAPGFIEWISKGRGAYAEVFQLKNEKYHRGVAVKMFDIKHAGSAQLEHDILKSLKHHRSIVGTFDRFGRNDDVCYFVMALGEYTVDTFLAHLGGPAPEAIVGPIACGLADGLKFLNKKKIIHCDVKPPNIILVGPTLEPQFIDFGLARKIPGPNYEYNPREFLGSPTWRPQEQARLLYFSTTMDLFASAMVIVTLLTGGHHGLQITQDMDDKSAREALGTYIKASCRSMPETVSAEGRHFLFASILLFLHEDRVGFPSIAKHPWLARYHIATGPTLRSKEKRQTGPASSSAETSRPRKTRAREAIQH